MVGVPRLPMPLPKASGQWERMNLLPYERDTGSGQLRPAVPKAIQDVLNAISAPGAALRGQYNQVPVLPDGSVGRFDPRMMTDASSLAGVVTLGSGAIPAVPGSLRMGVKAYHGTFQPFDQFDWSRLGSATKDNVSGSSVEDWALNLARLGPWSHEKPLRNLGALHQLPVDVGGKSKSFGSLEQLERFIRRSGGPESARKKLLSEGFGNVRVKDEEFGGTSYVSLSPDNFSVIKE